MNNNKQPVPVSSLIALSCLLPALTGCERRSPEQLQRIKNEHYIKQIEKLCLEGWAYWVWAGYRAFAITPVISEGGKFQRCDVMGGWRNGSS